MLALAGQILVLLINSVNINLRPCRARHCALCKIDITEMRLDVTGSHDSCPWSDVYSNRMFWGRGLRIQR